MDNALRAALAGDAESRGFHGATVRIKHFSAKQRLEWIERFGDEVTAGDAVEFYMTLITQGVEGVLAEDAETLRNASWPRFEELAKLVLEVNGIGGRAVEGIAGN